MELKETKVSKVMLALKDLLDLKEELGHLEQTEDQDQKEIWVPQDFLAQLEVMDCLEGLGFLAHQVQSVSPVKTEPKEN